MLPRDGFQNPKTGAEILWRLDATASRRLSAGPLTDLVSHAG